MVFSSKLPKRRKQPEVSLKADRSSADDALVITVSTDTSTQSPDSAIALRQRAAREQASRAQTRRDHRRHPHTSAATALRPSPDVASVYSIAVVSPDPRRRGSLAATAHRAGARRVEQFPSARAAQRSARIESLHDVAIVDGSVNDVPVLSFMRTMAAVGWRRCILVTSRQDMLGVRAAIQAGVRGYVVMTPVERRVGPERSVDTLSDREVQVLQSVAEGLTNRQIGQHLGLSGLTVKSHLARIARKLGTGDRAQLVAIGMRSGIIS